ncbi:MAG: hypothetical protein ACJ77X_10345 [Chloroflexota bacterium]|jgi:hypothetical protein
MSPKKGLGSAHLGPGKYRQPRLTPKEAVDEIASGCGYLLVVILAIPVAIFGGLAILFGIDYVAGTLARSMINALEEPVVLVAVGISLIGLAAWGSYRVFRNRRSPDVTVLAVVLWGVLDVVLISLGVIAIVSAVNATGVTGF